MASARTWAAAREKRLALGLQIQEMRKAQPKLTVRAAAVALGLPNHMQAYSALREIEQRPIRLSRTHSLAVRLEQLTARVAALEAKLIDPMLT